MEPTELSFPDGPRLELDEALASLPRQADERIDATVPDIVIPRAADEDPRLGSLSPRERQILRLIADGMTNRQIGERLGLAEKTVKNYVSSLLRKLGMERRTQAAIFQMEHPTP